MVQESIWRPQSSKLRYNMFTVIQGLKINITLLPDGRPQRRAGA